MRGDNLTIATLLKQPFYAQCSVGLYICMYFSFFFFFCKKDTLTHAAGFKGSFGMNVAFVGLSLTMVDLNPLRWDSSEVCGLQSRVEPRDFPPRLGFPREGGWRQTSPVRASSPACHWKGAGEGGENKPNHAVPAKITLLDSLPYTYKAPALPSVFLSRLTQQPVARSCCRAARFTGNKLKKEDFLKKKNPNPKATANC